MGEQTEPLTSVDFENVLPWYTNFSASANFWPCAVMAGSVLGVPGGAGWYIGSLLVMIVRPKLLHAVANCSMLRCMSDWLVVFRAQSSADRKS